MLFFFYSVQGNRYHPTGDVPIQQVHIFRLNCANMMYRTNQYVNIRLKSGIFPLNDRQQYHMNWRLLRLSQWNASVVTLKVEPSTSDGIFQGVMATASHMQTHPTWSHARKRRRRISFFDCSHTFVIRVTSLRSVDLTRNVTAGEGTGQVNINPDKSTMAGWNFDRIIWPQ